MVFYGFQEFLPNSDLNSSNGSVPRLSNLSTKVAPPPAAAREERLEDIAADIVAEFSDDDDDESRDLPLRRPLSAKNYYMYVPKTT